MRPLRSEKKRPRNSRRLNQSLYFLDEHGLLPAVWWSRDAWYGPAIAYLYRNVGWLQSNVLALIWLLSVGVLLVVFRNFCIQQIRSRSHRGAIEAITATRRNLHRQVLRLGPEDLDGTGHETAAQMFFMEVEAIRNGLYESVIRSFDFRWNCSRFRSSC